MVIKIAINGNGGSGKSTLADSLGLKLHGALVKHGDDYCSSEDGNFDEVECLNDFITPLLTNSSKIVHQVYNPKTRSKELIESTGFSLVIFEQVGSWRNFYKVNWDLKIWVDEDRSTCFKRMKARDGGVWADKCYEDWWDGEEALFLKEQHRSQADLILPPGSSTAVRTEASLALIKQKLLSCA